MDNITRRKNDGNVKVTYIGFKTLILEDQVLACENTSIDTIERRCREEFGRIFKNLENQVLACENILIDTMGRRYGKKF